MAVAERRQMTRERIRAPSIVSGSLSDGSLGSPAATGTRMLSDGSISLVWSRLAGWSIPLAFVLVFVKVDFHPSLTIHGASADPADLAILLTVLCALVQVRSQGLGVLRRSLAVWVAAALFLAFIAAASLYPRLSDSHYAWSTHLVTAAKFG